MTNGEKIKAILKPRTDQIRIYNDWVEIEIQSLAINFSCSLEWWNAEYKEPATKKDCNTCTHNNETDGSNCYECVKDMCNNYEPATKNDLALIHTDGLDEEIRCTMCTNHIKSDRGCDGSCVVNKDMYQAVINTIEKRIQPTTKNDLGVDCIKKSDAINIIQDMHGLARADVISDAVNKIITMPSVTPQPCEDAISRKAVLEMAKSYNADGWDMYTPLVVDVEDIEELPSVTPQLSSGLEKNSKKLEKDFGESDCISRKAALDITWHDPSYSDPLNVLTEVRDKIRELPSVTPQEPITPINICPYCGEYIGEEVKE